MEQHQENLFELPVTRNPLSLDAYVTKYRLLTHSDGDRWFAIEDCGRGRRIEAASEIEALDRLAAEIRIPSYLAWKLAELRRGMDE